MGLGIVEIQNPLVQSYGHNGHVGHWESTNWIYWISSSKVLALPDAIQKPSPGSALWLFSMAFPMGLTSNVDESWRQITWRHFKLFVDINLYLLWKTRCKIEKKKHARS